MRKFKLFSYFAAMMLATSMWAEDPIGCVDAVRGHDGSIYIEGWAFDPDNTNATLEIHVYMYKSGQVKEVMGEGNTRANVSRPDVDNSFHCGANHGFSRYISTGDVPAGDYWINVFAINAAGTAGGNTKLHAAIPDTQVDFPFTLKSPLTISYSANGGSNAPAAQQKRYGININLQGQGSLARTGYTTDGWATSSGGNKAYNFGASYSGNSSTTLYAHWNVVNYTIAYTLNGGSVSGNPTSYNITTNTITLKNPTRTGYTFKGWTGSNGNTPQTSVSIAKGSTGNKTYTANWTAVSYTITYNLNGGSVSGNPANYTIETAAITLKNPTKEGYTFAGWTGSNGNTPQTSVSIAKGSTENKSYIANWTPVNYTIAYNLDGGEVTVANPTEYTIETATFTLNNPTKEGATFLGWTGSNGEEPQTEVAIAKGSTENKSYTANWTVILKPCELSWKDVPEGGVVGIIGHEDEITIPQLNASADFILAFQGGTVKVKLGSTDESVLKVLGFNNFEAIATGECDVYAVHYEDAVFAYDSVTFHVTINPEPAPGPEPTVWTSLKVGDVIQVGDKIEVPVGDEWGINYNVLKDIWGPYELIRADIVQEHEYDDPVVTEDKDGAYYVFKAEKSTFYPLSNLGKGSGMTVTATSDGLEVTAAAGKDFTVAVHDNGSIPTSVEKVQGDNVQGIKVIENGVLYLLYKGTKYNVQGARVR